MFNPANQSFQHRKENVLGGKKKKKLRSNEKQKIS